MAEKKLITVVGATGAQGGGLVKTILGDKENEFSVRAVTRNPKSEKALKLKKLGADVVKADLNDLSSLIKAFKDSYCVFCVTNYWEHFSPETEMQQAKNLANAAKETDVQHVVWSSLEDTRKWVPLHDNRMPTLMENYKVPHFDAKGESEGFFKDLGLPLTVLYTSFYWDNFIHFGMGPQRSEDGNLYLTFPMADKKLPGIAAEDIGKCAFGIFKKGEELINTSVAIAGEHLTGKQMAEGFTKALDQEVIYNDVPADVYRSFGFQGADDLGNMFQFKRDFQDDFCKIRDVEYSRTLNPDLKSFEEWLAKHKEEIPIEVLT